MLYWSQASFLIWFIPLSLLPTFCLLLKTCSVVLSLSSFPMHSCNAEGTSSSRSNYLFLPERNSALIFKTTMSVRATYIETIELYHWRSSSLQGKHLSVLGTGNGGWDCPAPLGLTALPSLSGSLAKVFFGRLFILQFFISCISDPRRQLASELGCLLEALAGHMCQNDVWSLASV